MQKHLHSSSKDAWSGLTKFVLDRRLHSCRKRDSIRMQLDMLHNKPASLCMGSPLLAYCLVNKHKKDSMIEIFQSTNPKDQTQEKSFA